MDKYKEFVQSIYRFGEHLVNTKDYAEATEKFFSTVLSNPLFLELSRDYNSPLLREVLRKNCESVYQSPGLQLAGTILKRIPCAHFIHGLFQVPNGQGIVFFHETFSYGLALSPHPNKPGETHYSRFRLVYAGDETTGKTTSKYRVH